jgi:hypothetical protein
MRLSELIGAPVVDRDGTGVGPVNDVRLAQDGPMMGSWGAALRVEGLLVGRATVGVRLGYERHDVRGPWLLRVLFRWLDRRGHYIPWDDVESFDGTTVRLKGRAADPDG